MNKDDDDWDIDPDFVNDVSEKEQRWGSKTVAGSGHQASVDMHELREQVKQIDRETKMKTAPKPSYGYGGKFGIEKDRMDKSAVGNEHVSVPQMHPSQKDYNVGFGGKFGIQADRVDKSAVGWDYKEKSEKHASQKDYTAGFGGKYGVQSDRQDKSAVGWDYKGVTDMHPSQKDYSAGFGGKYGIQTDRQDPSAVGWDDKEQPAQHTSQNDYSKISSHRSVTQNIQPTTELHSSQTKALIPESVGGFSSLRAKFEAQATKNANVPSNGPSVGQQRVLEERARWNAKQEHKQNVAENQEESETDSPIQLRSNTSAHESTADHYQSTVNSEDYTTEPEETNNQLTAVAQFDYTADDDDELTFTAGELITEVEKIDEGWWKGVCRNKVGLFPSNFVALT